MERLRQSIAAMAGATAGVKLGFKLVGYCLEDE